MVKFVELLVQRHKTLTTIALLVILSGFVLQFTYGEIWRLSLKKTITGDLNMSIAAARDIANGNSPYNLLDESTKAGREWRAMYAYPPTYAALLVPISKLPDGIINLIVGFSLTALMALSAVLLAEIAHNNNLTPSRPTAYFLVSLALILCFEPIQNNYLYMQSNIPMFFGTTLFFYCYNSNKKSLAAISLAFAACLKLFPFLLVFYLIMRKEWKMIGVGFLATLFFLLFPIIWLDNILEVYQVLLFDVIIPRMQVTYSTELYASLHRSICFFLPDLLHSPVAKKICNMATLLILLLIDYKSLKKKSGNFWLWAIYLVFILLLMPQMQMHYMIFAIPAWYFVLINLIYIKVPPQIIALLVLSFIFYWLMLWIQATPAHFLSLSALVYICYYYMVKTEKRLTETQ